jgi:hypothetical protein
MPIAKGTAKIVAYKKESAWGTLAGATLGKQLRRVTSDFNLEKETYESNELRTDRQVADFRHGVRSATGSLNGELSSKTYADFMQSLVARDFVAGTSVTGLSITIAAGTAPAWVITRAAGSWITDGILVGQVVRLTAGTFNATNLNKNGLVTAVTALGLTVVPMNGVPFVVQGTAVAGATLAVVGKVTSVPATGHTDDSYTIEEWYADIAQSEVYTGMKVGSMAVQLPASGLATVDFGFMGKDLTQTGTVQYFTSPAAQGTDGIYAAVNGVLLVGGVTGALVTSADFSVERAMENATSVGSNSIADIFSGRIRVSGNLSVYFEDASFRNFFNNETPVSLVVALTEDNTSNSDFISFVLPKVKLGSFTKSDGELGITASCSFTALLNDVTGSGLAPTTIMIQDSQA